RASAHAVSALPAWPLPARNWRPGLRYAAVLPEESSWILLCMSVCAQTEFRLRFGLRPPLVIAELLEARRTPCKAQQLRLGLCTLGSDSSMTSPGTAPRSTASASGHCCAPSSMPDPEDCRARD